MDKTVIESYAIRFKKKGTYLPSKERQFWRHDA